MMKMRDDHLTQKKKQKNKNKNKNKSFLVDATGAAAGECGGCAKIIKRRDKL
jgi:hypothetical protein